MGGWVMVRPVRSEARPWIATSPAEWRSVARCATRHSRPMIKSFRHNGLRKFFETGSTSGIQASHAKRLQMQLAALGTAQAVENMDIPGFRLHPLEARMRGRWPVSINGNWRMTFEFQDGNAYILDYEDYHRWLCTTLPIPVSSSPASILNPIGSAVANLPKSRMLRRRRSVVSSRAAAGSPRKWRSVCPRQLGALRRAGSPCRTPMTCGSLANLSTCSGLASSN